ncbi:MAG: hypothetical protein ABI620_00425 [Chloroflexota bacterium]
MVVPEDHVEPGGEISILGSQITGRQVSLRLLSGQRSAELGSAPVASDGTFQASAIVPETYPRGYAELTATDENGNAASTIVLIGDRAEGPKAANAILLDERAIGLIGIATGVAIFILAIAHYLLGRPTDAASPD